VTTQTAIIITQDYGSSLSTPTLRNYLTDTLIVAADSANEVTADSGRYALVFDETSVHAAGWYALRAFVSGAPINRFVYFTGVDGETAIAVSDLPVGLPQTGQVIVTRPVGDDTPITFSFPVASATLTGTRRINNAGSTTALNGARSFLRSSGNLHLYSLAYHADDRPTDDGVVEYVFTDGTYSRSVVLRAVTTASGADSAGVTELLTRIPDATPGTEGGLPLLSEDLTVTAELDSASLRAALGMSAADLDSQLDAILAAASAGAGTGARTVTITVNDGTTALQNAVVRLTEGVNTFRALTNASGVATFNLDDATYTVAITKSGYSYAGTTLVVDGTETQTYSMMVVSITPPDNPDLSAIVVTCLGTDFETQSGVTIDLRIITLPTSSTNTAYPGLNQTATSNGSGIATLYAPKGSVCEWKRGKEDSWTQITIGSGDQTNVTSIIGSRY
jgi:hypothetical protein